MKLTQSLKLIPFALLLTACGGGGSSAPATNTPPAGAPIATTAPTVVPTALPTTVPTITPISAEVEGFYDEKSGGLGLGALILEDGTYWGLYGTASKPDELGRVVQGQGSVSNGVYTATNLKDFSFETGKVTDAELSASVDTKKSITGTLTAANQAPIPLTLRYDPELSSVVHTLADITGTYTGYSNSTKTTTEYTVTLVIDPAGVISGKDNVGCSFKGSAAPNTKGSLFNVSITFEGAPCLMPNSTIKGFANYDKVDKALVGFGLNQERTALFMFGSQKQ